MATSFRRPWILNQPFPPEAGYPAEILRAQHFDATSGGNGVSSPTALKVEAQQAPDGTVRIRPGGGTAVSNYAGVENQSYQGTNFQPYTLDVPPTGSSSGGRHDLLIQRFLDPQYEDHPEHAGRIPAEVAAELDFWWFELVQGVSSKTTFPFPHVPLAHIRRPPNTTIVLPEHIVDLRQLANPQKHLHMRAANLYMSEEQSLHTGGDGTTPFVWPEAATHTVKIPDYARSVQIQASWGTVRASHISPGTARGVVHVYITNPSGQTIRTQQSSWRYAGGERNDRFNIVLGDNIAVPASFRGEDCTVELRGVKRSGPNIYMDGDSSWTLNMFFEQEIA